MGQFTGCLIATDMDGTLLSRDYTISQPNREAILRYMAEGGLFVVATGRSCRGFEAIRPTVPYNAPCILSNGAVLYDYADDRVLDARYISGDVLPVVRDMLERFPGVGVEIHQIWQKYVIHRNDIVNMHFKNVGCDGLDIDRPEEAPMPWVKLLFVDAPELLLRLNEYFQAHHAHQYQMQFSCKFMAEIQDRGVDKGAGVARLAELLGISSERVFTVGDERNDLAMLRRFTSFAPENAVPEVKAAARYALPHHNQHAIAAMIAKMEELLA